MSLDESLSEQDYNIKDELEIRKILEESTEWCFEFTKNERYDYDLHITEWDNEPNTPDDNRTLGYVELERADNKQRSWQTGNFPDSWVYYSFLERKVREYNHRHKRWEGLKDEYQRTVYLKFNHALDNCFAAPITAIYRDGELTKRSDGSYNNTYRKLDFGHPDVAEGLDDCVEFIEKHLSSRPNGQNTTLLDY